MSKFKVGDRVRYIGCTTSLKGTDGIVVTVRDENGYIKYETNCGGVRDENGYIKYETNCGDLCEMTYENCFECTKKWLKSECDGE